MDKIDNATNNIIPDMGFTHDGVFHADDVFAAALLIMLNPNIKISRGSVLPVGFHGIAFDIGGGRFDHHFENRRTRANGIPFAAFGLLWEAFGRELLPHEEDWRTFDEEFVQPIDLADNTGEPCGISETIASFNPVWDSRETCDQRFGFAVQWAIQALENRIGQLSAQRRAHDAVRKQMSKCDGRVLILDRYLPWKSAVIGSGYAFVIFPSLRGGYNVQAVSAGLRDKTMVKAFPKNWRGKPASELRRITGIPGISFCHLAGFLCVTETLDDALAVADLSLIACEQGSNPYVTNTDAAGGLFRRARDAIDHLRV